MRCKALKNIFFLTLLIAGSYNSIRAQSRQNWTSAEIYQALRKLNVLGSVLYVAAHPDDENTRLLAYFSKDRLYRTGYLSLTRGDGGQNLIGNEQGIELGLIRTQELLAARRIDGAEQFFTRAYDFGYSKTAEETFTKWDREKILSDVIWVIRKFQPDIIITRFPTTGEGGHGHHTASAILANEAFTAAADPNRFPEQLKYVSVWKPHRIVWNTFNFGGSNFTSADQFKFDVGGYNPLLGKGYGEISAESRSQHKSQGFGVPAGRGEALEYFRPTGGPNASTDLMEGVELGWKKVKGSEAAQKLIDSLSTSFDFLDPGKSVKGLTRLYRILSSMTPGHWRDQKLEETKQLILQCSGLFMDATSTEQFAVKTDSIRIRFFFNNRLGAEATLNSLSTNTGQRFDTLLNKPLVRNKNFEFFKTFYVAPELPDTQPYWLEHKMEEGYFVVKNPLKIGNPDVDPSITMSSSLMIEGVEIKYEIPVRYRFTDPVKGELYQPLVVIPPLLVSPDETIKMTKDNNKAEGVLKIQARKKNSWVTVNSVKPLVEDKIEVELKPAKFFLADRNAVAEVEYKIKGNIDNEYSFSVSADSVEQRMASSGKQTLPASQSYFKEMHEVKYDHIPYINYFNAAVVANKKLDLKTYHKKIGYIAGAGDKVPEALEQMGYDVNILTNKELTRMNLDQFDAIITGIRAYNVNDWLVSHYTKLMKYVNDGGNLIVQYNTNNNLSALRSRIGPHPFVINRTRVTDENSRVIMINPEHPVFNFPNKITEADFAGWVQERSIYHGEDSTGKFEKLLSLQDPGDKAADGSLLVAKYGKGYFTYTGLVFFRQLPAGVPGAYRLLANIIALNRKKGF